MRSQLKTCSPRVSSSPSSIVPESWAHCQAFADRGDLEKAQAYLTKMSDTQQYYLFMQHAYLLPSPKWYDSPCNMNYFFGHGSRSNAKFVGSAGKFPMHLRCVHLSVWEHLKWSGTNEFKTFIKCFGAGIFKTNTEAICSWVIRNHPF